MLLLDDVLVLRLVCNTPRPPPHTAILLLSLQVPPFAALLSIPTDYDGYVVVEYPLGASSFATLNRTAVSNPPLRFATLRTQPLTLRYRVFAKGWASLRSSLSRSARVISSHLASLPSAYRSRWSRSYASLRRASVARRA